jgi:ABC-type antimicrobial peptide transport system permease subunit
VPLSDVRTLDDQIATARASQRFAANLAAGAAALTMLLTLVGIYGVLTTSVERRRRELAIRSALGATPRAIVGRVIAEGSRLTAAGAAVGGILSLFSGRMVATLLYGVEPRDPVVLSAALVLAFAASALAWMAPAIRAARVDPATVLRSE